MFDNRTFCRTFWIICFIFRPKTFSRTYFRTNKMRFDCLYLNKREFSLEGSWIRKAEYQTDIKWILSRFSRHRSRISQHSTLFFPRRATIISAEYILIRSKWWWRPRAIFLFDFFARNLCWWINIVIQNYCHIGLLLTLQHLKNHRVECTDETASIYVEDVDGAPLSQTWLCSLSRLNHLVAVFSVLGNDSE